MFICNLCVPVVGSQRHGLLLQHVVEEALDRRSVVVELFVVLHFCSCDVVKHFWPQRAFARCAQSCRPVCTQGVCACAVLDIVVPRIVVDLPLWVTKVGGVQLLGFTRQKI
jgi:hypothetical protein